MEELRFYFLFIHMEEKKIYRKISSEVLFLFPIYTKGEDGMRRCGNKIVKKNIQ